jgi:TetR/AcrR family transcriptional regulator, cholesterol catabolism regulator
VVETARRRAIEDAASALFRERGYAATSVRDIARAVDIQGASLYAHVTSKQDVLWSIVDRTAARFEAAAEDARDSAADPRSRLATLVRGHMTVLLDDLERASVFIHEWRALEGERRADIAARRDAYERQFREAIADGRDAGVFAPVDPAAAGAFILTALNGIVVWYRADGTLDRSAIVDIYAALALRSVGANTTLPT